MFCVIHIGLKCFIVYLEPFTTLGPQIEKGIGLLPILRAVHAFMHWSFNSLTSKENRYCSILSNIKDDCFVQIKIYKLKFCCQVSGFLIKVGFIFSICFNFIYLCLYLIQLDAYFEIRSLGA